MTTEDTDDHDAHSDMRERHTGQPRNVVLGDQGRGKGTGLGLSMVRDCAKLFGGTLEIDSTMGQGTRIVLPLSDDNAGRRENSG